MLIGCVECVVKVHEKCVVVPTEVILDIGIRESCTVEEVGHHDLDGVK